MSDKVAVKGTVSSIFLTLYLTKGRKRKRERESERGRERENKG